MITITLETSCLDLRYPELHELEKLRGEGHVELWIEVETEREKAQWKNIEQNKEVMHWMRSNTNLVYASYETWDNSEFQRIYDKVKAIHSPEVKKTLKIFSKEKMKNKRNDWILLTLHILKKRDFFVTGDLTGFINNGKKERFENECGTQVRKLDQAFINELKGKIRENKTN